MKQGQRHRVCCYFRRENHTVKQGRPLWGVNIWGNTRTESQNYLGKRKLGKRRASAKALRQDKPETFKEYQVWLTGMITTEEEGH